MKSAVLSNWNIPWLPSFALILFFGLFTIMLIRVFSKSTKSLYDETSKIPLNEGEK